MGGLNHGKWVNGERVRGRFDRVFLGVIVRCRRSGRRLGLQTDGGTGVRWEVIAIFSLYDAWYVEKSRSL